MEVAAMDRTCEYEDIEVEVENQLFVLHGLIEYEHVPNEEPGSSYTEYVTVVSVRECDPESDTEVELTAIPIALKDAFLDAIRDEAQSRAEAAAEAAYDRRFYG